MKAIDNIPPTLPYRCGTMLQDASPEARAAIHQAWENAEQHFMDWVRSHPVPQIEWLKMVHRLEDQRKFTARISEALQVAEIRKVDTRSLPCNGLPCWSCRPSVHKRGTCADNPETRTWWQYHNHPWARLGVCPACGHRRWIEASPDAGFIDYADSVRECEGCGKISSTRAWVEAIALP